MRALAASPGFMAARSRRGERVCPTGCRRGAVDVERSFVGAARGVLAPADSATSLLSYLSGARVELLAPIPVCRYARFKERSRVPLALTRRRRALVRRAKIGRPPRRKPRGKKEEGGDHPAPTHTSTMAVADPEDAEEAVVELDSTTQTQRAVPRTRPPTTSRAPTTTSQPWRRELLRKSREGRRRASRRQPFRHAGAIRGRRLDARDRRSQTDGRSSANQTRARRGGGTAKRDRGRGGQREGVRGTTQGWGFAGTGVRYGRTGRKARTENRPSQTADGGRRPLA